jgi:multisubunit Na+/H+ antiporter MnhB subunit
LPLDQDQDLLDKLDRKERLGGVPAAAFGLVLSGLTGAILYLTLEMEFHLAPDVAFNAGLLGFVAVGFVLAVRHFRR